MGRGKKTNRPELIKNRGQVNPRRGRSRGSVTDTEDMDDSFENIHSDDTEQARRALEQGYVSDGHEPQSSTPSGDSGHRSSRGGQQSVAPSWFQRYGTLLDTMLLKQEENSTRMNDLSDQIDSKDQSYVWKKEGLRKQNEVHQKLLKQHRAAYAANELQQQDKTRQFIQSGIDQILERQKDLRIADMSEAGWETVNVYKSHPVAADSDDDKKLRKADKEAVERLAAKRRAKKPNRPFNRRYGQGRGGGQPYQRDYNTGYRSYGSDRSQESSQRTSFVPDQRRRASSNDLCYYCGEKGHWADACPSKGRRRD